MQNGTLGAAMRLKALSQAPPEITRHMTTKQPKRYQYPKIYNPETPNHPHIRNSGLAPSTTGNIRGKRGGVRRAQLCAGTCMNPPSIHNTTYTTVPQYPSSIGSQHPYLEFGVRLGPEVGHIMGPASVQPLYHRAPINRQRLIHEA